jgi:hypothetical protein
MENQEEITFETYMDRLYGWVGPGYPDLDDPVERELFMDDVIGAAYQWALLTHEEKKL